VKREARNALLRWLLALTLLGAGLALAYRFGDAQPFYKLLRVPPLLLVAICVLMVANQALFSLRFAIAIEQCGGPRLSRWEWFRLTSVGQFLNLFVPQLGNVYRAFVLKRNHSVPYSLYGSGLFAFVWLDLIMGLLLAIVVIALLEPGFHLGTLPAMPVLALLAVALFFSPFVAARVLRRLFAASEKLRKIGDRSADLLLLAGGVARQPSFLLQAFSLNLAMAAVQVSTLALAFHAVAADVSLGRLMLFQIIVKLSNQIVVTPGNLGLTELAYGVLAEAASSGVEHGIAVGLLTRTLGVAVVTAVGLLMGGGSWLRGGYRGLAEEKTES
jgi:uncharacterized membrane protein YbhN (UPF0104 family)